MDQFSGIIGLILVALVFFFKNKASRASADAAIGKAEGRDEILSQNQKENEKNIKNADQDIKDLMQQRENVRKEYLNEQQRADKWNSKK